MFGLEQGTAGIPQGLDAMSPGPRLAALLSSIDVVQLDGRDVVLFARAQQRRISHDQARQYRALARVADLYIEESTDFALYEFAAAETGAALTLTRRAADREMGYTNDVVKRYPVLLHGLETGQLDLAKVRTMIRGVGHVDDDVANKALDLILPEAPNLTTGQIAARLRKLVIEADPNHAKEAYDEGIAQAKVWSTLEPDGTGTMIATGMEAHDLSAANRKINGMARRRKNAGDSRPIDKIRSEVFAQLLTGEIAPDGRKAQVNITGDLDTMERLNDKVGYLEGFGPVHADIMRQIVEEQPDATWTYEITDPKTGKVYVGTTSRRPTATQHRQLRARCKTCVSRVSFHYGSVRHRPHHRPRLRRIDGPLQSRALVPIPPSTQTQVGLERSKARRRLDRVDQPIRIHVPHPSAIGPGRQGTQASNQKIASQSHTMPWTNLQPRYRTTSTTISLKLKGVFRSSCSRCSVIARRVFWSRSGSGCQ